MSLIVRSSGTAVYRDIEVARGGALREALLSGVAAQVVPARLHRNLDWQLEIIKGVIERKYVH